MDLNTFLLIILIVVILIGFSVVFRSRKKEGGIESLLLLQNQIGEIAKTLDVKLGETNKEMRDHMKSQFSESQKLIKEITMQVSQVQESNKQVFSLGEQLQNLEKVLKNQKQRGNLGEAGLELILSNILPPTAYKMQYEFKGGEKVDAAIFAKEGIIPVDAKFSLDNYNRIINEEDETRRGELEKEFKSDLKKRIDETAKYIRPKEGTLPFAFMFIPAEGIYYDLLVNEIGAIKVNTRSLIEYAYKDRNVIIVSPTTFVAYLQVVLHGFRAFKIEESVKDIINNVEDLSRHIKAYDNYHTKLGNSLTTVVNHYNTSRKELGKIDRDVLKISGKEAGIEPLQIDGPKEEEE